MSGPPSIPAAMLGGSLLGQKKFAEAEPLIVSGYEGMKAREAKIPPPVCRDLTDAAERVVKLYEAWGKKDKAAEWRAKLAKPPTRPGSLTREAVETPGRGRCRPDSPRLLRRPYLRARLAIRSRC